MANGQCGLPGRHVPRPVEEGALSDQDSAIIHLRNTVEQTAKAQVMSCSLVTLTAVSIYKLVKNYHLRSSIVPNPSCN